MINEEQQIFLFQEDNQIERREEKRREEKRREEKRREEKRREEKSWAWQVENQLSWLIEMLWKLWMTLLKEELKWI